MEDKKWSVSMKDEKDRRLKLPNGEYHAEIIEVELVDAETSKSGIPYFLWTLKFDEGELKTVTTLKKGARWNLGNMLDACGIPRGETEDKKYDFKRSQVVGKQVLASIENKKSSFTGREGNTVEVEKSEIVRIKKLETIDDINDAIEPVDSSTPTKQTESQKMMKKLKKDEIPF